jgi:beta-lactamase class C
MGSTRLSLNPPRGALVKLLGLILSAGLAAAVLVPAADALAAGRGDDARIRQIIDKVIEPILRNHAIPGMAVAVTIDGERHFATYGLASRRPPVPVTQDTLFELGSVSKTFTATLAAYAEVEGRLSLDDRIARHVASLEGRPLGDVALRHLATHTAGGFPLQLPADVRTQVELMAWYHAWTPSSPAGTSRSYANPSVGLLGMATAAAMGRGFEELAEGVLFPGLGLSRTYLRVPETEMSRYAWGYDASGRAVRVAPALLASEAYGVKSNAVDMIRFVELNMGVAKAPEKLSQAIRATHTGYYRAGAMIQDLIWEQYEDLASLPKLVEGNSAAMTKTRPVAAILPPMAPRGDVLINKTGSTNGFGSYVAFIPARRTGIVILSNKRFPNEERVRAAFAILTSIAAETGRPAD